MMILEAATSLQEAPITLVDVGLFATILIGALTIALLLSGQSKARAFERGQQDIINKNAKDERGEIKEAFKEHLENEKELVTRVGNIEKAQGETNVKIDNMNTTLNQLRNDIKG